MHYYPAAPGSSFRCLYLTQWQHWLSFVSSFDVLYLCKHAINQKSWVMQLTLTDRRCILRNERVQGWADALMSSEVVDSRAISGVTWSLGPAHTTRQKLHGNKLKRFASWIWEVHSINVISQLASAQNDVNFNYIGSSSVAAILATPLSSYFGHARPNPICLYEEILKISKQLTKLTFQHVLNQQ